MQIGDPHGNDITDRVMRCRNILVDPFNTLREEFETPVIVAALALLIADATERSSDPAEARDSFVKILDSAIRIERIRKRIARLES